MSQPTIFDLEHYPLPPARPRRRPGRIIAIVVVLALLGGAGLWAVSNRQYLADQLVVWNYTASDDIEGYITRSTMTDKGAFLFTASAPAIVAGEEFNEVCGSGEAGTGILGCYLPRTKTISLYDVTDERLDGIEDVVASHEMLHAAWDRMSAEEQAAVVPLLEAEATALAGDAEFVARMDLYDRTEPGERDNELHSIIGTEFAELSPELEKYYSRYFSDRSVVVGFHAAYVKVFSDLETQALDLSSQILALADEIDADTNAYNSDQTQLNADIDAFIARNQAYGYSNDPAAFDRDKAALIARDAELGTRLTAINDKKTRLGDLQKQLRDLDADAEALNRSIDSTIVPGEGI